MRVPRAYAARVAIVTGAAGGQGAEHARRLSADGIQVVATDILDASSHCPGRDFRHLDVASEKQWSDVVSAVVADYGRVDVLVNNAGVTGPSLAIEGKPAEVPADQLAVGIPLGRLGAPADISALVSFLASDASSYLTGAEFVIDGGIRARI
jgi:NAD(P)-dependent dehydrogenase (short-subunit alcohol dehydrogenase family)